MEKNSVKELVTTYLSLCSKLHELEPDFSWSNLLGDYGEYLGIKDFGLIKVPASMPDRIQEMHIAIGQIICDIVEENLC